MLQDKDTIKYIADAIKPLKKQMEKLKDEVELLKQKERDREIIRKKFLCQCIGWKYQKELDENKCEHCGKPVR